MAIEFTATFNPEPNPPTSNQFSLAVGDTDVSNLFPVDATTEIKITLAEGASFPTTFPPIVWSLPPDSGEPTPVLSGPTNNILTLSSVPAPAHVLSPWVFRFIADVNGVTGVRSQNIYLAKPLTADPEVFLQYGPDGNFFLSESLDSPQVGITLAEELVLVNVHPSRSFTVNLVSAPSSSSIRFADSPIVWSSGEQPDWISDFSSAASTLSFTVGQASPAMGHSIGLQFAITVTPEGGDPIRVLSPDPILINSTWR